MLVAKHEMILKWLIHHLVQTVDHCQALLNSVEPSGSTRGKESLD
jgi:hypothetical protein